MSETTDHTKHLPSHEETYSYFIKCSVAVCLYCGFILVALCSVAYGATLGSLSGFGILVAGLISVLIDFRAESRWLRTGSLLFVVGLLTGINVS